MKLLITKYYTINLKHFIIALCPLQLKRQTNKNYYARGPQVKRGIYFLFSHQFYGFLNRDLTNAML